MRCIAIGLVASSLLTALASAQAGGLGRHIEQALEARPSNERPTRIRRCSERQATAEVRTLLTDCASGAVMQLGQAGAFGQDPAMQIRWPSSPLPNDTPQDRPAINRILAAANRSAEQASAQAGPVFREAINTLGLSDPYALLESRNGAACQHLQYHAGEKLRARLHTIVAGSAAQHRARQLLEDKLPDQPHVMLDDHVARATLAGLFQVMAVQERRLRELPDASHRPSA
ncbi:DUF4197 family protein [Salinisphaera sp. SPP-AMP-43]|uniref:DUF4197 family protein n=1 Tax=Salinisphaera sp. SPP-AMP-43 TaxID=3121288 RepID=UPI003C6DDE9B